MGMIWLTVIFDPVELWNSPTSQTRKEKEYFDSTFRPFYRATQIIVKADNRLEFVSCHF
jgi:Niemann-Pick C1 protein